MILIKHKLLKVFAAPIPKHNEVIWFYPSADSEEINRYVIYNYLEQYLDYRYNK